jgi:hypothetical protein
MPERNADGVFILPQFAPPAEERYLKSRLE